MSNVKIGAVPTRTCFSRATQVALGSGDITGVAAGTGLTGGGTAGDLALAVNPAAVQSRVSGKCTGGAVTEVAQDGTVVCRGYLGYSHVEASINISPRMGIGTATVCPEGGKVMSGSVNQPGHPGDVVILRSYAATDAAWGFELSSNTHQQVTVKLHTICLVPDRSLTAGIRGPARNAETGCSGLPMMFALGGQPGLDPGLERPPPATTHGPCRDSTNIPRTDASTNVRGSRKPLMR